jgi:hypothetical protein
MMMLIWPVYTQSVAALSQTGPPVPDKIAIAFNDGASWRGAYHCLFLTPNRLAVHIACKQDMTFED